MDLEQNNGHKFGLQKEIQLISPQDLVKTGLLKEGSFGYIHTGRFRNQNGEKIVIKSFKGKQNVEKLEYFYLDLCCISEIKDGHENVAKIIGYFDNPDLCVVMNYEGFYTRGKILHNLLEYLLHLREEWERRRKKFGDETEKLFCIDQQEELHSFAIGIAKGCEYLHSKKITHGDLATRNILIDRNKRVKLSDYGMLNVKKHLVENELSTFSLRWMAPELIQKWKISAKADVWSFGDVVWEIGTLGALPYCDSDDQKLLALRLKYPNFKFYKEDNFTDRGIKFLQCCFNVEPERRPDFTKITNYLVHLDCQIGKGGECALYNLNALPSNFQFPPSKHDLEKLTDLCLPLMNQTMFTKIEEIGSGSFGHVHLVQTTQLSKRHSKMAVKIIYDHLEPITAMIIEKVNKLKQHQNLVKLLGISVSPQNEFIAMEYESFSIDGKGTELTGLEEYLICLRENLKSGSQIDNLELGWITSQIVRGMVHLESQAVVHGNLSARNILINNSKIVKITDYFMPYEELKLNDKCRWASPELLNHGCYTIKSDVWAFGIILWEIATLGGYPFGCVSTLELKQYKYIHPEIPSNVSSELRKLMSCCWKKNSIDRISFNEILSALDSWTPKKEIYLKYDFVPVSLLPPTKEECEKILVGHRQSKSICLSTFSKKSSNSQESLNSDMEEDAFSTACTTVLKPIPAVPTTGLSPSNFNKYFASGKEQFLSPESPFYGSQYYPNPPTVPSPTRPLFHLKMTNPIYHNSYVQATRNTGQTVKSIRFSPPN